MISKLFIILMLININIPLQATNIVGPADDIQGPAPDPANADFDGNNICHYTYTTLGTTFKFVVKSKLKEFPDGEVVRIWTMTIEVFNIKVHGGSLIPHPTKSNVWIFDDVIEETQSTLEYDIESESWTFSGAPIEVGDGKA